MPTVVSLRSSRGGRARFPNSSCLRVSSSDEEQAAVAMDALLEGTAGSRVGTPQLRARLRAGGGGRGGAGAAAGLPLAAAGGSLWASATASWCSEQRRKPGGGLGGVQAAEQRSGGAGGGCTRSAGEGAEHQVVPVVSWFVEKHMKGQCQKQQEYRLAFDITLKACKLSAVTEQV
ncbi:elastin-like isoform X2 [Serinus canaria]|uniref:elastin-like isoform X2 n=1 Tax=Serinus canaria TaxID=9135 RepID=UPI0021CC5FFF|nr:elastin-like isoform X2 [Serinus canaria]